MPHCTKPSYVDPLQTQDSVVMGINVDLLMALVIFGPCLDTKNTKLKFARISIVMALAPTEPDAGSNMVSRRFQIRAHPPVKVHSDAQLLWSMLHK